MTKDMRRARAQKRAMDRAKRSPQEQLARLDKMFGKDQGATRERARLSPPPPTPEGEVPNE